MSSNTKTFGYRMRVYLTILFVLVMAEYLTHLVINPPLLSPAERKSFSLEYVPTSYTRLSFPTRAMKTSGETEYYINEKGYRGHDFPSRKPKSKTRIMICGGSSVFDIYATYGKDWPHLVETILHERGYTDVEVINAGMSMYNSIASVNKVFTEGHLFEPDYLVFYSGYNDIKYFHTSQPVMRWRPAVTQILDPRIDHYNGLDKLLSENSQLYLLFRNKWINKRIGIEGKRIPDNELRNQITGEALRQYELNVKMFVDLARNINAVPILMTEARYIKKREKQNKWIADQYVSLTFPAWQAAFEKVDEIILRIAEEKQVHLFDLEKHISGNPDFFVDPIHLHPDGSRKLAELTAEHFINIFNEEAIKDVKRRKGAIQ